MQADYFAGYRDLYQRHWWWRERERFVVEALEELNLGVNNHILDVGCGEGLSFPVLKKWGRVDGIEPGCEPEHLPPEVRPRIHCGPLESFVPPHPYDLIVMLDVLEHLENPVSALVKVRQMLQPGGVAVLTVPALPMLWSGHDTLNHHQRRYTKSTLVSELRQAGFEIGALRYFYGWIVPLKLGVALKEALLGEDLRQARVPPRTINSVFRTLSRWEHQRLPPAPLGNSLLAVVT